jgi:thioredoxin 1
MILQTNLTHVESAGGLEELINSHSNVMLCCGRMGPMCVPVYQAMTELENNYPQVKFCDMAFDVQDAHMIRNLPECRGFMGLPFTVYYRGGEVVEATSGLQTREQVQVILDRQFG